MAYTVNKLAKLSGVSVRTLHFYDEIGLLKPQYYGDNNYRYYGENELLMLQQILFFRQLGLQLSDIRKIVSSPDFDKLKTLESHRSTLEKNLDQTKQLIETIDQTISHLRGVKPMKLENIFNGFDAEKQMIYENFLVDSGVSKNDLHNVRDKIKNWSTEQWLENKAGMDKIHAELVEGITHELSPSSAEVQNIIQRHYQMTCMFWTPTRETYIGLSQLYASHPNFVKFYNDMHPKLLEFLMSAMKTYAEKKLT
jgi:DNA-binding transcriptional MerR regulator